MFYVLLCVHSSFVIILMERRELVALLCLSSWCFVIVVCLFLRMPRVCLQFVIMVFPDHTHYFKENGAKVAPITTSIYVEVFFYDSSVVSSLSIISLSMRKHDVCLNVLNSCIKS